MKRSSGRGSIVGDFFNIMSTRQQLIEVMKHFEDKTNITMSEADYVSYESSNNNEFNPKWDSQALKNFEAFLIRMHGPEHGKIKID